ncbi:MAG: GNAT family N-acetyltransferase [Bacteroidetes bacterium]|nr:GNAT family N-acetyltransferase [Bacteroidota bacterium]
MNEKYFLEFAELKTERLYFTKLTKEDIGLLYSFNSSEESLRYIARDPFTKIEQAEELFNNFDKGVKNMEMLWWRINLITGESIGYCGLFNICMKTLKAEVGYGLLPDYWGKGYAGEMAKRITEFGMNNFGLHRMWGRIEPKNKASIRVLQKLGYCYEGTHRDVEFAKNKYFDMSIYALINEES